MSYSICAGVPTRTASSSREKFDQITQVLSEGFTSRRGRGGAFLHRDGVHGRLTGRTGRSHRRHDGRWRHPGQRRLRRHR